MFAFVKNLFGRRRPQAAATTDALSASVHTPPVRPTPAAPFPTRPDTVTPRKAEAAPRPVTHSAGPASVVAPTAAPPVPPDPKPVYSKETVDLPLKQLWPKLKTEVTQRASATPKGDALLRLPLNIVQAHLAKGSMNIPYAQLRQFSPAGLFPESPANDADNISLPISEILPRLKPEQLPRRPGQRKIAVPEDIEPVFGPAAGKNGQLRIAPGKGKATSAPPEGAQPSETVASVAHVPASAQPANAPPPAVPVSPSTAQTPSAPAPVLSAKPSALPAAPPEPTPSALPTPVTPISPIVPDLEPASPSLAAQIPTGPPAAPAPVPPPVAKPNHEPIRAPRLDPALASLRAQPAERTLNLALMDVAAFWAEKGRVELENLYRHSVEIPAAALEAALKRGKVEFSWREMRPWMRLATGNTLPTFNDDLKIELPLSVMAPRFLELQTRHAPKKRVQIGNEIPDIFVRHIAPPEPAPIQVEPALSEPECVAIPVSAGREGEPREFGEIFGQPEKKVWSLGEVSHRTSTLPGVAGAIIATPDGLLVGGSWPAGVGGEAVAAFAPQMYNRMASYSKELKLGEPGHFTLLVENVPLQIFKSSNSYFTVLGRAGESLPERELNAIATRLAASLTGN